MYTTLNMLLNQLDHPNDGGVAQGRLQKMIDVLRTPTTYQRTQDVAAHGRIGRSSLYVADTQYGTIASRKLEEDGTLVDPFYLADAAADLDSLLRELDPVA